MGQYWDMYVFSSPTHDAQEGNTMQYFQLQLDTGGDLERVWPWRLQARRLVLEP